ncbi:MAG: homoserine dehydrogenase [Candidatus Omnitrophica bacterium]|nr:homoserine dehydrogenase [Candidatus Omnitrophota bacterium]
MKKIKVGLIGFGTIGTGVVRLLQQRSGFLAKRAGIALELAVICDKDLKTKRSVKINSKLLTSDISQVIDNPEIDIVIELMGGIHPAKEFILKALKNKKSVITANKALLAEAGEQIFRVAAENNVHVYFEASVGGGIPVIKSLREGLAANKIQAIYGIVNGTTNFILSEMSDKAAGFKEVLALAREKGYAEAKPALDIDGIDPAHKLAIMGSLGFGANLKLKDIYIEGIRDISATDICYAAQFGYVIKLLAIAKRSGRQLEARVHPTLIPANHLLAQVKGVFNAVFIDGDQVGKTMLYGKGAGQLPTASAVVSDLIDVAHRISDKDKNIIPPVILEKDIIGIKPMSEIQTRYYIRFSATDQPGVLAGISSILAGNNISIASVIQIERHWAKTVPIIMMTHEAGEKSVQKALKQIDQLVIIKKKSVCIRIETLED